MREKLLEKIVSYSEILLVLSILILIIASSGCSSLHILKECRPVQDMEETYVCKNLKPWE